MKNEASNGYWNNTHPRAFENMIVLVKPYAHYVSCPLCKGHGAWHLAHYPHTRNGVYAYFDASCSQCNGWGYIDPNSMDAKCMHSWRELSSDDARKRGLRTARWWHNFACKHCNTVMATDSSD